jgi:hypothetical protein
MEKNIYNMVGYVLDDQMSSNQQVAHDDKNTEFPLFESMSRSRNCLPFRSTCVHSSF